MRPRRRTRGMPDLRGRLPAARTGPHDEWLDAVATKLSDLGLHEVTRNTGEPAADIPTEADLVADGDEMRLFVRVFANAELAAKAEQTWTEDPDAADAADARAAHRLVAMSKGRLVLVAASHGRASVPRREFERAVVTVAGTPGG